jgi:hypothetical protein
MGDELVQLHCIKTLLIDAYFWEEYPWSRSELLKLLTGTTELIISDPPLNVLHDHLVEKKIQAYREELDKILSRLENHPPVALKLLSGSKIH